jgi:hypothetical protein
MNSNIKKYLVPAIGGVAFVIGGLLARSKTLDGIETLENSFAKRHEHKQTQELSPSTDFVPPAE